MGDDTVPSTPLAALASQVNRFGASAPAPYRFAGKTFSTSATMLEPDLALVAVTIYQRRAADSYAQFHDAGSEAEIAKANLAFANPVSFVSTNMGQVTQAIGSFADSLGLPSASSDAGSLTAVAGGTLMMIAGLAIAFWVVTRPE